MMMMTMMVKVKVIIIINDDEEDTHLAKSSADSMGLSIRSTVRKAALTEQIVMMKLMIIFYQVSSVRGDHNEGEEPPKSRNHPGREGTENVKSSTSTHSKHNSLIKLPKSLLCLRKHLSSDKFRVVVND